MRRSHAKLRATAKVERAAAAMEAAVDSGQSQLCQRNTTTNSLFGMQTRTLTHKKSACAAINQTLLVISSL